MGRKIIKSSSCINCKTELSGENYCPNCGQINDIKRPSLISFIIESLGNFFAFDSKFFRTIGHLFWRPGKVALEYVDGKRTKWMKPVRLYFLSSLLFLFLGGINNEDSIVQVQGLNRQELPEAVPEEIAENLKDSTDLMAWKDENGIQKIYSYLESHPDANIDSAFVEMELRQSWWNLFLFKQFKKQFSMKEGEFSRFLETKAFWILFLFLPIFSFFLKLVYNSKDIYYLEHLYFAFYTQSAFFLILSLTNINKLSIGIPMFNTLSLIGFALYLFLAMRNFYQQGIGKTILKYIIINLAFIIIGFFFFLITLIIGYIAF
tara:strand:+ start:127213 stop:128169 length:957 start_codon:yes stop_codon:yes gene_type:complete